MEMSPWAREQNKALSLKQAQRAHVIKLRVEHSYFPKSHFITRPKKHPHNLDPFSKLPNTIKRKGKSNVKAGDISNKQNV